MAFRSLPACLLVTVFVSAFYNPAPPPSAVWSVSISWGTFKMPSQHNIALPGPYMNDGSLKTLKEAVDCYVGDGRPQPTLSPESSSLSFLAYHGGDDLVQ